MDGIDIVEYAKKGELESLEKCKHYKKVKINEIDPKVRFIKLQL